MPQTDSPDLWLFIQPPLFSHQALVSTMSCSLDIAKQFIFPFAVSPPFNSFKDLSACNVLLPFASSTVKGAGHSEHAKWTLEARGLGACHNPFITNGAFSLCRGIYHHSLSIAFIPLQVFSSLPLCSER